MNDPNWREKKMKEQLCEINGFQIEDLSKLDMYEVDVIRKVLVILLEWACYPQNEAGIMLGRRKIAEVPIKCLELNLMHVIKNSFDYSDYWNYRRLLELIDEFVPNLKKEALCINENSEDPDIIDVINDYK